MTKNSPLEVNILKPFGPRILHTVVPQETVRMLNRECDNIVKNKQKREKSDASYKLVGHVTEELKVDLQEKPALKKFGMYLGELTKCLVDEHAKERIPEIIDVKPPKFWVHSAWFIRSFETDYNPIHLHTSGQFTCVLYLKVPKGIKETNTKHKKENYTTEGHIDFIYGSSAMTSNGNYLVMPVVGDLYIFPAFLYHTVYPFFGKGERRSLSANFTIETYQEGPHYLGKHKGNRNE